MDILLVRVNLSPGPMSDSWSLILREVPEASRPAVAQFLAKAFALKENTAETIAASAPIALLTELTREEAGAMSLAVAGLGRIANVVVSFTDQSSDELPKIDWPRRPLLFKREIADYVLDYHFPVPVPDLGKQVRLIDLLVLRLGGDAGGVSKQYKPIELAAPVQQATPAVKGGSTKLQEYKGSNLPEITPFSNRVQPQTSSVAAPARNGAAAGSAGQDASDRLNEMFPDEDGGFIPDSNNITSILDRLLPDEGQPVVHAHGSTPMNSSGAHAIGGGSGFSLFLAKIGDEQRRTKAVTLLVELAKIPADEAEALSKKVIIPVLKGVTKEEAESAKQRFAKIGILARIKGAETAA